MWQLAGDGLSRAAIRHGTADLRQAFDGVYVSGHAPPTLRQRLMAAALTAPHTWVDRWSAAHAYGLWSTADGPVCIIRAGSGGPRKHGCAGHHPGGHLGLVLSERRSGRLEPVDLTTWQGVPMLTPARVVLDLLGLLRSPAAQERVVRDALRLRLVDGAALRRLLVVHRGCRGAGVLRGLADEYAGLPVDRTRSDAEAAALGVLKAAALPLPRVNVAVAGHEADLVWPAQRFILELDSNEYHAFPALDERKQAAWEASGWRVKRLGVDVPEGHPWLFLHTVRAGLHLSPDPQQPAVNVQMWSP